MTEALPTPAKSALDAPERRRLLALLRETPGPVTAAELAARLDLHITTIRFHLEALEREGLVARGSHQGGGRGRPALTYRARGLDVAEVNRGMIVALADALDSGADGADEESDAPSRAVAAGRRWATELGDRIPSYGSADAVSQVLELLGFEPEPTAEGFTLHACPFLDAAQRHREVVCGVHLGLLQGASGSSSIDLRPLVSPTHCTVKVRTP